MKLSTAALRARLTPGRIALWRASGLATLLLVGATLAGADEPEVKLGGLVDLRYAHTGGERSWLDSGLGKLRYGAGVNGRADLLRVSQLSLLVDAELSLTVDAHLQLNADAEPDEAGFRSRVDLIEAYVLLHPQPWDHVWLRVKGGAFFPPISLEHEGPAWSSRYTITGSAVNSWVGEELRTVGVEAALVLHWDPDDLRLFGAAFGSNDPTGELLAWRGWALHDRQTGFGDRLPLAPIPALRPDGPMARNAQWENPMMEIDGRVGWYAGARLARGGLGELRAMHYDNRGLQSVFDGKQYAWYTTFDSYGLRLQLPRGIHLLGQYMRGTTHMGFTPTGAEAVEVPFYAGYAMLSVPLRRHRLSVRWDHFETEDEDALPLIDPNQETGHAWTACYAFEATEHQRLSLEVIHVQADRAVRPALGLPLREKQTLLQASWRIAY